MNSSGFRGSQSPYTPRGRGRRSTANRFSPLVADWTPSPRNVPDFTPSPAGRHPGSAGRSGRGGFSPAGRGGFSPAGRGGFSPAGRGGFSPAGRGGFFSPAGSGSFSPRGRGGFSPRGRGGRGGGAGGGGLCFDDTFVRFATENPWSELERGKGLPPALGPLNTAAGGWTHRAAAGPPSLPSELPVPDDDDTFV